MKTRWLYCFVVLMTVSWVSASPGRQPNIVLIMADDLGYECLRVNGGRSYHTPRLNAMATQGLRFTHCHSQPVCTPSRVKIMTGRFNSSDFVPTLVELSDAALPAGLSLDGVSFAPQLQGQPGQPKEYIFCHYDKGKHPIEGQACKQVKKRKTKSDTRNKPSYTRWVRDKRWKLYDNGKLFDVVADPDEQRPIQIGMDPAGDRIRRRFQSVLDKMGRNVPGQRSGRPGFQP